MDGVDPTTPSNEEVEKAHLWDEMHERTKTHAYERYERRHNSWYMKWLIKLLQLAMLAGVSYGVFVLIKKLVSKKKNCTLPAVLKTATNAVQNIGSDSHLSCVDEKGKVDTTGKCTPGGISIAMQTFEVYPKSTKTSIIDDTGDGCVALISGDGSMCGQTAGDLFITSEADDTSNAFAQTCIDLCGSNRTFWIAASQTDPTYIPRCACMCGPKK